MPEQLALGISGKPPSRPTVAVRVEEILALTYTSGEAAAWWIRYRDHGPSARFAPVAGRIGFPGQLIDVLCDDRGHAEWLRTHLITLGIPKAALKIVTTRDPADA